MNQVMFMSLTGLDVSCETYDRLELYVELLKKWNKKINLISQTTEADVWARHIIDSAQIISAANQRDLGAKWLDIGSGAGLPGLVVTILRDSLKCSAEITLVESDTRKCAFLSDICRRLDLKVEVINQRIEALEPLGCDVLISRAFAPLNRLLTLAYPHLLPTSIAFLLKGERATQEIELARKHWLFNCRVTKSITHPDGCLLELDSIENAR